MGKRTGFILLTLLALACTNAQLPTNPIPSNAGSAPAAAPSARTTSVAPTPSVSLDTVAERAAHTATSLPSGAVLVAGGCVIDGCGTATEQPFWSWLMGPEQLLDQR